MKFAMILKDGDSREDEVRVSVWESSEYEMTASTADPDDADGQVILSAKRFIEPNEGDTVRLVDFKLPYEWDKRTYQGQPKLDSRWESEIEILDRAPDSSQTASDTAPQRVGRSSRSSDIGEAVPRSQSANFDGEDSIAWPEPPMVTDLVTEEIANHVDTTHKQCDQESP
jgi:hypothetical protein